MPFPGPFAQPRRRRERGFTLLELMVVVAILGLLIALVAPAALNQLDKAKQKTTALSIARLSENLEMYKLDVGSFPSGDQGLQALITKPADAANWNGPYIKSSANSVVPSDAWGHPFIYRTPSNRANFDYDLCSYGSRGQAGGSTDGMICNNN